MYLFCAREEVITAPTAQRPGICAGRAPSSLPLSQSRFDHQHGPSRFADIRILDELWDKRETLQARKRDIHHRMFALIRLVLKATGRGG